MVSSTRRQERSTVAPLGARRRARPVAVMPERRAVEVLPPAACDERDTSRTGARRVCHARRSILQKRGQPRQRRQRRAEAVLRRTSDSAAHGVSTCADLRMDDTRIACRGDGDGRVALPNGYNLLRYLLVNQTCALQGADPRHVVEVRLRWRRRRRRHGVAHGGSVDIDSENGRGNAPCGSRCLRNHRCSDPTIATVVEADVSTQPADAGAGSAAGERTPPRRAMPRRRRRRGLAPGGVVTIEYSPSMDGDPDPGEIVWTWVPYEEDPTQGKDRPVVIIGRRGHMLVASRSRPSTTIASRRSRSAPATGIRSTDRATPASGGCSTSTRWRCGARARSSRPTRSSTS